MFGNKHLHQVTYSELAAFLHEQRDEGVRLDYKESWTNKIVETACAFANTYGGYIFYGVKEVEQPNRPNQPDPEDVSGLDFSKGDPAASLRSKIMDNTRPVVEPQIHAVPLEGSTGKGVLIVQVEESVDAPHEVLFPGATRIPVRRADTTVSASLDEIERLIERRDSLRAQSTVALGVEFFTDRLRGGRDGYGDPQRTPPMMGVAIRPWRSNSVRFAFDSSLDQEIRQAGLRCDVADTLRLRTAPVGLIMEDHEDSIPDVRVEVHRDGTIRSARVLLRETRPPMAFSEGTTNERWLDFGEVVQFACAMVRFAATIYALRRPGVEMEVWFGLADCTGHKIQIPGRGRSRSHSGQIPDSPFYQQPVMQSTIVDTDWETARPVEEDVLTVIRELSRFFQISVPDDRLQDYLR